MIPPRNDLSSAGLSFSGLHSEASGVQYPHLGTEVIIGSRWRAEGKTMKALPAVKHVLKFLGALAVLGSVSIAFAQEGYFRAENRDGIWWIIDPRGASTLTVGVDNISYESDQVRGTGACPYCETLEKIYPDRNAWGLEALARIRQWGFNSIGAWSDPILWTHGVPYTVILDIAERAGANWQQRRPADYFDARFEKAAADIAGKVCQPRRFDHMLLGYFSDNELRWGPDWGSKETMLEMYLKLPAPATGRLKAGEFLRKRYGNDIGKLDQAWGVSASSFEELPAPAASE